MNHIDEVNALHAEWKEQSELYSFRFRKRKVLSDYIDSLYAVWANMDEPHKPVIVNSKPLPLVRDVRNIKPPTTFKEWKLANPNWQSLPYFQ